MSEVKEDLKEVPVAKPEAKPAPKTGVKIAVILVRGLINTKITVRQTVHMLGMNRKNACVMIPDTPSYRGMLNKVKDVVTWGAIDDKTEKLLIEKRGKKDSKVFHLNPPRKGFGRKGIKQPFGIGGGLGDRKEKINDLILRMI